MEIFKIHPVKGLNVFPWPLIPYSLAWCQPPAMTIYLSTINFHVNSVSSAQYTCQRDILPDFTSITGVSMFSYFSTVTFFYGLDYGPRPACPHLFKNSSLSQLVLNGQVDSFLYTSLFRFQQQNDNNSSTG
jgi:hypothetical protein